jgi:hypothetical protein
VDTPYMDDVAKNGLSPWGRNRAVTQPNAEPPAGEIPISMAHPDDADPPPHDKEDRAPGTLRPTDR